MGVKKEWMTKSFVFELYERIKGDDVSGWAAQLAFFFLLSIFPLLIFLVTLLPYLPIHQEDILSFIRDYAPEESMKLIETNVAEIMKQNGRLLSFGVIATLWTASNGINSIIKAFNRAYDVKENRSFIVSRGLSIVLTIGMIFVFVIALLLPVFGKQIGSLIFAQFGFSDEFLQIWGTIRWLLSSIILFIVFLVLYWIAPNIKLKCLSVVPGTLFATIGWILVSYAFSYYVSNFGNYTSTYGSIGGIIVLMIWFYLTAHIIILGGEINAMVSEKKDPTCG
ncbi:YihY/virulence factor BrkB family protein [Peribacillus acanthi]|uniref:YihY/virulence factor BrkB family protein n=1 Tax=Peribacillus acanthi TaxID=2171554 RepID=UPI001F0BD350|nr:YihY/virulence factor BrkB family protein [Peribacillus acanthi]